MPIPAASAPEVYDHLAVVPYLTAWFAWWQSQRSSHTHRAFAGRAQVGPGTLENVLAGRRRPSGATLQSFNRVLGLDDERLRYLQLLGELTAAVSVEERLEILARVVGHPGARAARRCVGDDVRYLGRWTNVAVRELARLGPIPRDPSALRGMLAFDVAEELIHASVEDLLDLGMLEIRGDTFVARDRAVETEVTSAGSSAFHVEMLDLARRSVGQMPPERRFLGSLTLTIPQARLPELQAEIWTFLRKMRDLSEASGPADTVAQLHVQLFPLGGRSPVRDG
jgi:uncharacterized protein (TIGR02147 family)